MLIRKAKRGKPSQSVRNKRRGFDGRVNAADKAKRKGRLMAMGVPGGIADSLLTRQTNEDQTLAMIDYCRGLPKKNG